MGSLKRSIIYFVRHGESVGNVAQRVLPVAEDTLTEKGKLQAKLLGELLHEENFNMAYTSPFPRTLETAKTILSQSASSSDIRLQCDARIQEKNMGAYENKPIQDMVRDIIKSGKENIIEFDEGGMETKTEMEARLESFFQDVFEKVDGSDEPLTILTVTHGATLLHMWKYLPENPRKYIFKNWRPEYYKISQNTSYFKMIVQKSPPPGAPREIELAIAHGKDHLKGFDVDTLHKATLENDEFKKYRGCFQQ